jgi:hypothetical protein
MKRAFEVPQSRHRGFFDELARANLTAVLSNAEVFDNFLRFPKFPFFI